MSSNLITFADGRKFKVRTEDRLAKVCGPVELREDAPGEWYEHDGPLVAWFRMDDRLGFVHSESKQFDMDPCLLAVRVLRPNRTAEKAS